MVKPNSTFLKGSHQFYLAVSLVYGVFRARVSEPAAFWTRNGVNLPQKEPKLPKLRSVLTILRYITSKNPEVFPGNVTKHIKKHREEEFLAKNSAQNTYFSHGRAVARPGKRKRVALAGYL